MNTASSLRCLAPASGASFESFFLETLSEVGSMNLVLALSSDPASAEMLERIRKITSGLLVLNGVYYESECLRFLGPLEAEAFHRKWGLPVKWLRMGGGRNGSWKADGQPCPPYLLKPLLLAHNMTCLIAPEPKVFAWAALAPVEPNLFGSEPAAPTRVHAL